MNHERTFTEGLKLGLPNLIVSHPSTLCNKFTNTIVLKCGLLFYLGDVLRTVLTLYMENEDLPLPTLEEVLICNQDTTVEEVNMLDCNCTLWYILCSCIMCTFDIGDVYIL